jgi:histone H3/H4
MRHRESWAEEQRSPTREAWAREQKGAARPTTPATPGTPTTQKTSSGSEREGRRTIVRPAASRSAAPKDDVAREILIVASKLKAYIRASSGMNTSDSVMAALSEHVRVLCDDAVREARKAERKTIMDRDFPKPRRG